MAKNKIGAPALSRTMTAGQMEMISLGGAIGVGLFMGSTASIKWTGPSVLLAYAFVGLLLYIVMRSLGEMIYLNPGTGSFADYATEYVHPWRVTSRSGPTSLNTLSSACPKWWRRPNT